MALSASGDQSESTLHQPYCKADGAPRSGLAWVDGRSTRLCNDYRKCSKDCYMFTVFATEILLAKAVLIAMLKDARGAQWVPMAESRSSLPV